MSPCPQACTRIYIYMKTKTTCHEMGSLRAPTRPHASRRAYATQGRQLYQRTHIDRLRYTSAQVYKKRRHLHTHRANVIPAHTHRPTTRLYSAHKGLLYQRTNIDKLRCTSAVRTRTGQYVVSGTFEARAQTVRWLMASLWRPPSGSQRAFRTRIGPVLYKRTRIATNLWRRHWWRWHRDILASIGGGK